MINDANPPDHEKPDHWSDQVDDRASRVVDGDMSIDEVEPEIREVVGIRVEQFLANRQHLQSATLPIDHSIIDARVKKALDSTPSTVVPFYRNRKYLLALGTMAAAIVGVAVIGLPSGRTDTKPEVSTVLADAAVAQMAPFSVAEPAAAAAGATIDSRTSNVVIVDAAELRQFTGDWFSEGVDLPLKITAVCADPLRPAVDIAMTLAGDPAEIHFGQQEGVVVYRLSDCSVLAGIVP